MSEEFSINFMNLVFLFGMELNGRCYSILIDKIDVEIHLFGLSDHICIKF